MSKTPIAEGGGTNLRFLLAPSGMFPNEVRQSADETGLLQTSYKFLKLLHFTVLCHDSGAGGSEATICQCSDYQIFLSQALDKPLRFEMLKQSSTNKEATS